MVCLICKVMDTERPAGGPHERLITFITDRPGHDWRYAIDASKIQQELGWVRAQRFEAEIGETVRWYLQQSAEC